MAKISDSQMQVLINCIGAVETGGQIYGKRQYDDYTSAYANASTEDSITIGAFAEFKGNAKALLKDIQTAYPDTFKKYDNAGIASDLEKSNWTGYNPDKTSAKAKAIVNIISSDDGKKVQDERIVKLLNSYIAYAENLGVVETTALFMCANFIHQGGNSACKRLVGKIDKPYTLDKLYNATLSDTGNQVGVYKSRQKLMYQWIKEYVLDESDVKNDKDEGGNGMTEIEMRKSTVDWIARYIGIKEGSAKHKEILDVFNKSKMCTRYTMTTNDAWCATTVSAAFIACGLAGKVGSGSLFECVECSCYYMVEAAKKQGIWVENDAYKPSVGDVILYDWDDKGSGDNTGVPDHVGIVASVDGNNIKVIEGNMNDTVGYRTIAVNGKYIRGFIVPKYADFATVEEEKKPEETVVENVAVNTDVVKEVEKEKEKETVKAVKVDDANSYKKSLAGTYKTTDNLNLRCGAGTKKDILCTMPKGSVVNNYGYYTTYSGVKWYYVTYVDKNKKKWIGFCSSSYLVKK